MSNQLFASLICFAGSLFFFEGIEAVSPPINSHCCPSEEQCDCENKECCEAKTRKAWFYHTAREDKEDPTYELEEDTAWPSEREEFSDQLFR